MFYLDFKHISEIKSTCENCGTTVIVKESNFRNVCSNSLYCPTCKEHITGVNRIASKVFEFNQAVDALNEELEPYNNISV